MAGNWWCLVGGMVAGDGWWSLASVLGQGGFLVRGRSVSDCVYGSGYWFMG